MELREGLERIVDMCDGRETCDGCALDWGAKCALDYVPCGARPSDIDKICEIVEQIAEQEEQEEQSIENAQLYVMNHLDERTKLEQLAEEANELSQAALKLIRAKGMSGNATPVTADKALDNLQEEVMDVLACLVVLDVDLEQALKTTTANPKWLRWANRLKGETK